MVLIWLGGQAEWQMNVLSQGRGVSLSSSCFIWRCTQENIFKAETLVASREKITQSSFKRRAARTFPSCSRRINNVLKAQTHGLNS
jgi:hypothetical protein